MNIVRGVTGLLRRSLVPQESLETQDEPRPPSNSSATWPEINFKSDNADEHVLESLWKCYKDASNKVESQGEAEAGLTAFLAYFLEVYESWVPTEPFYGGNQSPSSKEEVIFGCSSGHPTTVVASLVEELKGIPRILNTLSDSTKLSQATLKRIEDLLHVLEILNRSAHNRHNFLRNEGLQILVNVMKAAVVQMKRLVSTSSMEQSALLSTGGVLEFLQGLLLHVVKIISLFVNVEKTSIPGESPEELESHIHDGQGSMVELPRKEKIGLGGSVPLMEMGGLNWFVELLRLVKRLRASNMLLNTSLQQPALRILKAVLVANVRAQNHFKSLGGIDVLINAIGCPHSEACSSEDFEIQVLSLEVLREAVYRNLSGLQYVLENGGVNKFVEVIIWAAFIFPKSNLQGQEADNLQGWNSQVSRLCKVLCSFLVETGDIRGFVTGLACSHDALSTPGSYWELATRWILKVLLGTFRNLTSSQATRPCSTTLQHYTLYVFKKMLAACPGVLSLFHEEGLWEVMFSEYFFYFEMSSDIAMDGRRLSDVQVLYSSGIFDYGDHEEIIDSEPLRLEVISFVELAATANNSNDNLPECRALMVALEQCARIPSVATTIVKSLHRILQLAPDQTVRAFGKLKALVLLSQVMDIQLQEYNKIRNETTYFGSIDKDDGCLKHFTPKETWCLSRESVFNLFAEYVMTSEEARIVSLHNTKTLQVLFDLLWDLESRRFALGHILDLMKLPPTSDADQEAKLELCIKYLETLSRSGVDGKLRDKDLLMELLSGIRDILETDTMYYQSLFQEAECFVHIVSLLNENISEETGKILCLSVIQTLRCLLAGNKSSKEAFRSLVGVGYTTLQTLLLNSHPESPTEELLNALLDMLVDGDFNAADKIVIQNEDIIILFFSILQKCCEQLQLFGLFTFHRILESTANKASGAKAGLLSLLLDWFGSEYNDTIIAKLAILIETLGRHSISGKDMRRIFSLLRSARTGSKPMHRKILLKVVQGILREEGPAAFFDLSGKDSGIIITSATRWPNLRGFTFSCWMRIDTSLTTENPDTDATLMGLFTFLTDGGKGYSAMINPEKLVVQAFSQRKQSVVLNVHIVPKHWFHLTVTHSVGGTLSSGGILRVYIDGRLASDNKLRYPKFSEPLSRCSVGCVSPLLGLAEKGKSSLPFCGQLGPIYFFEDSLSSDQILQIFQAGPGYMYSFLPTEIGCLPENITANSIFDMKDGLSSKLVFGFNAQASSGCTIYNVALNSDGTAEKMSHEATIMSGTQLCYRHLVKDIIDCVGGVGVFFPLLTQLDQPVMAMIASVERQALETTENLNTASVYDAAEVIDLITSVLSDNYVHQQYMHQNKGISIIGFLLQSVSPQNLTTTVANSLVHLLSVVSKRTGGSFSNQLVNEILLKVFLNLNIWIYTPYTVQRELLMALLNFCETECGLAQSHITLPRILDLVQQFYWVKSTRKVSGTKRLLHPLTKQVIGVRPSIEEVGKLRILLLSITEIIVRNTISMSDVKAIIAFLERTEDPVCLEDVLNMLLRLLSRKEFAVVFVEDIQILGGCQLFLGLLEREEEALRILGLQIIGHLLNLTPEKKGSWLSTIATGVTRSLYDNHRVERTKHNSLFSAIMERLIAFPFSDLVRASLFDMLLGGASLKQVLQRSSGTTHEVSPNLTQFALPQVLGILMKFLLVCDDKESCCTVLKDLLRLLEANPSRSDSIVLEPFWQCWLFDLLAHIQDVKLRAFEESNSLNMLEEEETLIYDIFAIIHLYCTYHVKGGWRHVERTINATHLYADKGSFSRSSILHHILGDLLEALLQARSQETGQMPQPCRDNALYLLTLMDELLIKDVLQFLPAANTEVMGNEAEPLRLPSPDRHLHSTREMIESEQSLEPDNVSIIDEQHWQAYNRFWVVLADVYGKDREDVLVPSLGQRARGLVESMNLPAAEMAAAVVAGGFGAVVSMNPGKLIDKAVKLRGEKFPRVVCHLALFYVYRASLAAASSCIDEFVSLLPLFLASESEQCKNRLQLFLWCLLQARTQLALVDDGPRFHLISHFIKEIVNHGKNMLSGNMTQQNEDPDDTVSILSLLQQDRIIHLLQEEKGFLRSLLVERSNEVHSLNAELIDAEDYGNTNLKFLEEERQSILSILCINDSTRLAASELVYEEDQQFVANHWCHMFRHLTDERGPWSTIPFPDDVQVSWKLDKTEDPWRRRLKLKRNYSLIYDQIQVEEYVSASTSVPVAKVTAFDTLLKTSKLLLKGLRGISEEEIIATSDEETNSLDEHMSIIAQETDTVSSSLEAMELGHEDSVSLSPERGIQKSDDEGIDKVVHSTVCVLVTPKRKLAGRLEVTENSLHFYGDFLVEGTAGSSVFTSSGQLNYNEHVLLDGMERAGKNRADIRESNDHALLISDKTKIQDRANPQQSDMLQGQQKSIKRHRRWDLLKVKAVHGTRYLLQYTALEIFFDNSIPPVFLNFPFQRNARDVGLKIISLRNSFLFNKGSSREKMEFKHFVDKKFSLELAELYKDQWRRREISNFEYLMYLNTLAGRSYNDLTQYPIFPWVISDYTSETLDLNVPFSFRDLSKPVGALDAKRFEVFEERFQNFSDPDIPSFYYGSHYSSMGIVLFYLLRLEPFTCLHRSLQGGKFDHADRLFHSIEGTYRNCLTNTSDVKELIPEFFYMPEFLVNSNKYHMGVKQDGERLDNVALPPWAEGSPEKFISKNREALESEYVSQHLHEWIDLIFGYKQRGRPAVEAANVFYHLTYEGAVELESMEDRLQRAAVEDQIANFGQTPIQLFRKKHPRRGAPIPISRPLFYAPASITLTSSLPASVLIPSGADKADKGISLLYVGLVDGKVVVITSELKIIVRNWVTASQAGGNFTFSSSQEPFYGIGTEVSPTYKVKAPFAESVELNTSFFEVLHVRASSYVLTCGHWDNSFRVMSLTDGSLVQIKRHHRDVVSCLAVSSDGTVVVSGSNDTTIMVWEVNPSPVMGRKGGSKDIGVNAEKLGKWESILSDSPLHVLSGHDDAITCVAVSVELDIVVSGSRDCSCIIHTLRLGRYVRSIQHPSGSRISKLIISKHGQLVLFSNDDLVFFLYSVNGKHLASSESNGRINCLQLSSCEEFFICGGDQSQVVLRSVYTLQVIRKYDATNVPILSLSVTPEDCFLVAMQDGSLLIYSIERQQQKKSSTILQTLRARSS